MNIEKDELEVKVMKKEYDISLAKLEQKRAQKRIEALQADIDRSNKELEDMKHELEILG